MGVATWACDSARRIRTKGLRGAVESARPVKYRLLSETDRFYPSGTSIYDYEWDLLVVLDACRLDLMMEVADEFDWIESVNSVRSVNSATRFWMQDTFTKKWESEMEDTAYVCGNPFSETELRCDDFARLIELWKTAWTEPGTVPPEGVTDETVRLMRNDSHDRVIAHYMQPHCPFVSTPELCGTKRLDTFGNQDGKDIWAKLRDGDVELERVWEGYLENLRIGLNEVETLLSNVDAETVVVTSDHGNATGKWWVYGHPGNLPFDSLRIVPWIRTVARDTEEYSPKNWLESESAIDREEQLSALGYA